MLYEHHWTSIGILKYIGQPLTQFCIMKILFLVDHVSDALGCGDTCDLEFVIAYASCPVDEYDDVDDYMASMALFFVSDCYDCLCHNT